METYYRSQSTQLLGPADENMQTLPSEDALENLLRKPSNVLDIRERVKRSSRSNNYATETEPEMKRYRQAIRRLSDDVLSLQRKIRDLEITNEQLRRRLNEPAGASMPAALDRKPNSASPMSASEALQNKEELQERYGTMKSKLSRQADEIKIYRDKVLQLQNQLIQKNELEKDFLKNKQTRRQENELEKQLDNKVAKVRGLEEAYRKQEKVIEKMEKLLQHANIQDKKDHRSYSAVLDENQQLKSELQSLKELDRLSSRLQENVQERLNLHQKQEKAQGRIRSLEKQLSENARTWAHEKADLILRLREAELGLRRPSSVLLDYSSQPNLASSGDFSYDRSNRAQRPKQRLPSINRNY